MVSPFFTPMPEKVKQSVKYPTGVGHIQRPTSVVKPKKQSGPAATQRRQSKLFDLKADIDSIIDDTQALTNRSFVAEEAGKRFDKRIRHYGFHDHHAPHARFPSAQFRDLRKAYKQLNDRHMGHVGGEAITGDRMLLLNRLKALMADLLSITGNREPAMNDIDALWACDRLFKLQKWLTVVLKPRNVKADLVEMETVCDFCWTEVHYFGYQRIWKERTDETVAFMDRYRASQEDRRRLMTARLLAEVDQYFEKHNNKTMWNDLFEYYSRTRRTICEVIPRFAACYCQNEPERSQISNIRDRSIETCYMVAFFTRTTPSFLFDRDVSQKDPKLPLIGQETPDSSSSKSYFSFSSRSSSSFKS